LSFPDVEPWPDPVKPAQLLDEILNLNPASPKNQSSSPVFYSRIVMIQYQPMPCVSLDLGFFNRYILAIPKMMGMG